MNEYTPSLITRLLQNPCWFKQGDMPRIYTTYIISVFLFGVFNRILKLMLVKSYIHLFIVYVPDFCRRCLTKQLHSRENH